MVLSLFKKDQDGKTGVSKVFNEIAINIYLFNKEILADFKGKGTKGPVFGTRDKDMTAKEKGLMYLILPVFYPLALTSAVVFGYSHAKSDHSETLEYEERLKGQHNSEKPSVPALPLKAKSLS